MTTQIKEYVNTSSHQYPTVEIYPVTATENRPFWSVMIPTYNCASYLVETLKSVLEQDPGLEQMQIEVVDDCSTKDDPEAVVREIGQGRVSFFRQPQNVGAPANFNTCVQRAKGHWVHILHGDDIVLNGFYRHLRQGIEQEENLGAAFCRYIIMDENSNWQPILSPIERDNPGVLDNFLYPMALQNRIMTPCIVLKRSVYEKLGGFNLELFHSADWDMWKRTILNYPVWFEPQTLACFRQHSSSDTSRLQRSGDNIREACRAIEIAEAYLPADMAKNISERARESHASTALDKAVEILQKDNLEVAIAQIDAAIECSQSPKVNFLLKEIFPILTEKLAEFNLLTGKNLSNYLSDLKESCIQAKKSFCESLNLRKTNYVIFPDWNESEESICEELVQVLKKLYFHPNAQEITLLIEIGNINEDDANHILSSAAMKIFWEENIEDDSEIQISLFSFNEMQWKWLIPCVSGYIHLFLENTNLVMKTNLSINNNFKLDDIKY
jgi:hypothetical protein